MKQEFLLVRFGVVVFESAKIEEAVGYEKIDSESLLFVLRNLSSCILHALSLPTSDITDSALFEFFDFFIKI